MILSFVLSSSFYLLLMIFNLPSLEGYIYKKSQLYKLFGKGYVMVTFINLFYLLNNMVEMIKKDKRTARSSAIIDEDDVRILFNLILAIKEDKDFLDEELKNNSVPLAKLEKDLNFSRKSILNHLVKLEGYGWLKSQRSLTEYKEKIIFITSEGWFLFKILVDAGIMNKDLNKLNKDIRHKLTTLKL